MNLFQRLTEITVVGSARKAANVSILVVSASFLVSSASVLEA